MLNTILFDLDGTLLSIDTDRFIVDYFSKVSSYLSKYFTESEVTNLFWGGTKSVIKSDDGTTTNQQVFFDYFFEHTDIDPELILPYLDAFYDHVFPSLKPTTLNNDNMLKAIDILKEKGYNLVIATNPIFPAKAIMERIHWADLDPKTFSHITTFETSHYAKPNPHYFEEILKDINKTADEVLMVGNHYLEDMIAHTLDIETFLVNEHAMGEKDEALISHEGSSKDFLDFVQQLPKLK